MQTDPSTIKNCYHNEIGNFKAYFKSKESIRVYVWKRTNKQLLLRP